MTALLVRAAEASDYEVFARLLPELGTNDPLPSEARFATELAPQMLIAARDATIVGYAYGETLAKTGYVRHVVADPAHRRQGVGKALLDGFAARFAAAGCKGWCLNVKPDNDAARRLYESLGMRPAYEATALSVPYTVIDRLDGPTDGARPILVAEESGLEARFDLPSGQLAHVRATSPRILLTVEDAGVAAAVAAFDPTFPGAFPFRVTRPALARALFLGCKSVALADFDHVRVVIEDDAPLTSQLVALGATIVLLLVHYRGELDTRGEGSDP